MSRRVSIIMPMHNNRAYVAEAVESALAQDYLDIELVAVDDGSTDGSHEVVAAFDDPRIHLFRTENRGPSAARNAGVEIASGDLITFLDSDDLLTERSVSSRAGALIECDADAALSWNFQTERLGDRSAVPASTTCQPRMTLRKVHTSMDFRTKIIKNEFGFATWGILIKKDLFQKIGGFDPHCRIHVDVEMFSRLAAEECTLVETFEPIYIYRRRPGSVSGIDSPERAAEALRTLRKICRNLDPWLKEHPRSVAQKLFNRCVQAYPHWTEEHYKAMDEARRLMNGYPFDLSCVGGPRAWAIARLFGWRAGRIATRTSSRARAAIRRYVGPGDGFQA